MAIVTMRIELNNNCDQLAVAMNALQDFADSAGVSKAVAQAAALVLDELLVNIISYGYPDPGRDVITLELDIVDDHLQIKIIDGGIAFNPLDQPAPDLDLPLEQRQPGGLGIHLVKEFMDDYAYEYRDERNIVTLRKKLQPGPDQ